MTGSIIAQLIIAYGPKAFELIKDLRQIWTKELTLEEVNAFCDRHKKSYDEYIAEAKLNLGQ